MMASRKAVLDKNKQQLLDSVNASNKVYNNEELSILLAEQQEKIKALEEKHDAAISELKARNASIPIGEYDLFHGNYATSSGTYATFHITYQPFVHLQDKFNHKQSGSYKVCFEFTTSAYNPNYAYFKLSSYHTNDKVIEHKSGLWGADNSASTIECMDIPNSFISDEHYQIQAKVTGGYAMTVYRIYLLVY